MKVENITKQKVARIKAAISPQLMKHPLFMFYCPEQAKREKFISNYLDYYISNWSEYGELYSTPGNVCIASLVSTEAFEFGFFGKNSLKIKYNKFAKNIFVHREVTQDIVGIIIPNNIEARVFNIFSCVEQHPKETVELIVELQEHAKEKGFALVYETFSRKLVDLMSELGFEIAFQRQFLDTQFIQTFMTYNVDG